MIDLRQIRYFIAVAETLHVGRAAEILHISQPPLSRQISLLEKELGAELFIRHARGVSLTPAGEQFLNDGRAVLLAVEQACTNTRNIADGKAGSLSVGFMMHAAYNIVPALARRFIDRYPEIDLKIQEVVPGELTELLYRGVFDTAIMIDPGPRTGLHSQFICSETLCLALPGDHRLAGRKKITATELRDEAFIATPYDVAPMLREAIDRYCLRAGFKPLMRLETQLQQTIVNLVAEGLGIALVPEAVRKAGPESLVFLPLPDAPSVEYVMLWREDNINPALESFMSVISS